MEERNNPKTKYVSLREAAKHSEYSQDYLSLRARQGKLKAVKFGRNWVTTKEWLEEYRERANNYTNQVAEKKQRLAEEAHRLAAAEATAAKAKRKREKMEELKEAVTEGRERARGFLRETGVKGARRMKGIIGVIGGIGKRRAIAAVLAVAFILVSIGVAFGEPYFEPALKRAEEFVRQNAAETVATIKGVVLEKEISGYRDVKMLGSRIVGMGVDYGLGAGLGMKEEGMAMTEQARFFIEGVAIGVAKIPGDLRAYLEEDLSRLGETVRYKIGQVPDFVMAFVESVCEEVVERVAGVIGEFGGVVRDVGVKGMKGMKGIGEGMVEGAKGIAKEITETAKEGVATFAKEAKSLTYSIYNTARNIASKGYRFLTWPWRERPEKVVKEIVTEVGKEEIEALEKEIEEIKEKGLMVKEKITEVSKITQVESVKEIIKETRITKIDEKELKKLKSQIANIQKWETDIKTLQTLTAKLQTHPPYTQVTTAPVYIGSSGIQVGGAATLASLVVSGSVGVKDLGVGDSTTLGSDASDQLTVRSTANFLSPTTIENSFRVGDTTNYLTVDSTGNLTTTGNLTVAGALTVGGAAGYGAGASFTASSTTAVLAVNQTGSGDLVDFQESGTTLFSIDTNGDVSIIGTLAVSGTSTAATYISAAADSTVRKTGEEVMRDSVPIYRYEMPSQTSTTTYFRISKYLSANPLISKPAVLPGGTRVYRLIIKYSDDIPVTSSTSWRIYRPEVSTTTDTFTLPGVAATFLNEGVPYVTDVLDIPDTDWQVEVRLPAGTDTLRVFQVWLAAYDRIK